MGESCGLIVTGGIGYPPQMGRGMARFRKRPVEIDAFRLPLAGAMPDWLAEAVATGVIREHGDGGARINTLEGLLTATPGDWIIRGVKGELYSCKPEVFALTYEAVEDERPQARLARRA